MTTFVYLYTGGSMAQTPEEQQASMQAWGAWFGELGDSLVEGGNPFGASAAIGADGSVSDHAGSGVTGYSVVSAVSLADATARAKGCPILTAGGGVEIHEAIQM